MQKVLFFCLCVQIDTESGKKVAANLKEIEADLQQMKNENNQLLAQLKA